MELEPWDPLEHHARIEVRRQESDDSDAEGGLGNVTRAVIRPPGHSGKAKRGHLCFDASFESGNLGRVDFISEFEYDLFLRPDTCNPRYRLWFNFVVDNVRVDQRVVFNIVNLSKIKTLFREGMTPLVRTSSRPKWQRLPGKYVYFHKSPEHRNHFILSFAFAFDREEDVFQFAFSFPYTYARAQAHIDNLEGRDLVFFKRETIAMTLQQRKLDVLTISNISNLAPKPLGPGEKKPKVVFIMSRCHPGESPTSIVVQGIVDFLISSHPLAMALKDHLIFKIVPMINPDGVFLGNYRSSLMGYDLNRHWNQVSPWAHPGLHALKNYLLELDSNKNVDLDMVIDIHAHSSLMGAFIYGNAYDDVYRFERHILFPKLLAHNAEDFNPACTMYNRDPGKSGTARRHLCEILGKSVNVYALEVSFYGYHQQKSNTLVTYNEDGYLKLGRNLVRTFFDYYKATSVIPSSVVLPPMQTGVLGIENDRISRKQKSRSRSRSRSVPRTIGSKGNNKEKKSTLATTTTKTAPKTNSFDQSRRKSGGPNSLLLTQERSVSEEKNFLVQLSQLTRERKTTSDSSTSGSESDCKFNPNENINSPTGVDDDGLEKKKQKVTRRRRTGRGETTRKEKKQRWYEDMDSEAESQAQAEGVEELNYSRNERKQQREKDKNDKKDKDQVGYNNTGSSSTTRSSSDSDNNSSSQARARHSVDKRRIKKMTRKSHKGKEKPRRAVYKTFDFSGLLRETEFAEPTSLGNLNNFTTTSIAEIISTKTAKITSTTNTSSRLAAANLQDKRNKKTLFTGRKIGGGGIVSRKKQNVSTSISTRDFDSEPFKRIEDLGDVSLKIGDPRLTIIDFNMLIRNTMGGSNCPAATNGNSAVAAEDESSRLRKKIGFAFGGLGRSGYHGFKRFLSKSFFGKRKESKEVDQQDKGSRKLFYGNNGMIIDGQRTAYRHRRKRQHYVRRRKAILLRGNITDCSPWEDGQSSHGEDSDCSKTSRRSVPNLSKYQKII